MKYSRTNVSSKSPVMATNTKKPLTAAEELAQSLAKKEIQTPAIKPTPSVSTASVPNAPGIQRTIANPPVVSKPAPTQTTPAQTKVPTFTPPATPAAPPGTPNINAKPVVQPPAIAKPVTETAKPVVQPPAIAKPVTETAKPVQENVKPAVQPVKPQPTEQELLPSKELIDMPKTSRNIKPPAPGNAEDLARQLAEAEAAKRAAQTAQTAQSTQETQQQASSAGDTAGGFMNVTGPGSRGQQNSGRATSPVLERPVSLPPGSYRDVQDLINRSGTLNPEDLTTNDAAEPTVPRGTIVNTGPIGDPGIGKDKVTPEIRSDLEDKLKNVKDIGIYKPAGPVDDEKLIKDAITKLLSEQLDVKAEREAMTKEMAADEARDIQSMRARTGLGGMGLTGAAGALESQIRQEGARKQALTTAQFDRAAREEALKRLMTGIEAKRTEQVFGKAMELFGEEENASEAASATDPVTGLPTDPAKRADFVSRLPPRGRGFAGADPDPYVSGPYRDANGTWYVYRRQDNGQLYKSNDGPKATERPQQDAEETDQQLIARAEEAQSQPAGSKLFFSGSGYNYYQLGDKTYKVKVKTVSSD